MQRRDRSARIVARARLWVPLVVVAAVPVSVLVAGGDTPVTAQGHELTAFSVPNETNTTTGIGRSLCRIIGTPACQDTSSTGTASGGTDTSDSTDTASDTGTGSATSGRGPTPPETGLCSNVKVPGCRTTTSSSTVTVAPPGTLTTTKTKASKTHSSSKTKTKSSTRSAQSGASTVTVTVTRSSSASATTATTTAATTTP